MTKYPYAEDGEWFNPSRKKFRHMCCDCSLVHAVDFKLEDTAKGKQIYIKFERDNRATATARRNTVKSLRLNKKKKK